MPAINGVAVPGKQRSGRWRALDFPSRHSVVAHFTVLPKPGVPVDHVPSIAWRQAMVRSLVAAAVILLAATTAHAETAQQSKMKECNATASEKALKGDGRKAFMSDCLKAKPAAAANSQQDKMKACNAEAKTKALKGDERKAFMSTCLKG